MAHRAVRMRHKCGTVCFMVFLICSLLLYLAELALQVLIAIELYSRSELLVWFALLLGFITVPLVTSQLLSCPWAWPADGRLSQCLVLLPHLLCVAVPWRYNRLILTCGSLDTKKELSQLCLLRLFVTFSSGLPILLLQTYLLLNLPPEQLPSQELLYASLAVGLFSASWSLASHRKRSKDYHFLATLISWPGTVFRVTWRLGELAARLLILALFAGLHSFWILLVVALHWLTMFTWSLTEQLEPATRAPPPSPPLTAPQTAAAATSPPPQPPPPPPPPPTSSSSPSSSGAGTILRALRRAFLSSYAHIFCYLNINRRASRARFVLFYLVMCLENAVLLVLWLLYDVTQVHLHVPLAVIVGACYALALLSAVLYYNCFHLKSSHMVQRGADVMYMQPCLDCCSRRKPAGTSGRGGGGGGGFQPAWWVEVKENTDANPNTYDMLLPSELQRVALEKRAAGKASSGKRPPGETLGEPRYWTDIVGVQPAAATTTTTAAAGPGATTDDSSAVYESLSLFNQRQEALRLAAVMSRGSKHGVDNAAFSCSPYKQRRFSLEDFDFRAHHFPPRHQFQISADSGISASDQSGGSRQVRSDASFLYTTSDTSDLTSTRTSLSYLDPRRVHQLGTYSDDWSLTSSSYGVTSSESVRGISMYLPMLTHLNGVATEHRAPAPLPPPTGQGEEVQYDHVASNLSQITAPAATAPGSRRRRPLPRMGRSACYRNERRSSRRRRAARSGRAGGGGRERQRVAVTCGVAGKLHRRRHSDASDVMSRSGGSLAGTSVTTEYSYDGSQSEPDWEAEERAGSLQLPGTQSDLDFSVCGDTLCTDTDCEYVQPTRRPHLPTLTLNLNEAGQQIGFVC